MSVKMSEGVPPPHKIEYAVPRDGSFGGYDGNQSKNARFLLSLSDEDLQNKLRLIASSIGFDERIAAAQTADVTKVRTMLKSAGTDDINRLINAMGRERADIIIKTLGGGGNG